MKFPLKKIHTRFKKKMFKQKMYKYVSRCKKKKVLKKGFNSII